MTVDKQPRALYLADVLAAGFECDQEWYEIEAAKELRRLHAENLLLHERHAGDNQILRSIETQRDELLEALKQTLSQCLVWQGEPNEWSCSIHKAIVEQARFAIAKATGETK